MNKLILALFVITISVSASAFAQNSEGYLGQISNKYMVRGQTYDMSVYSYDFSPGIDFTSPSGQRSHTVQESLMPPYYDGRGTVKYMQSKFYAYETGNYQMRVFSWDYQGPNMTYSMSIGAGPGSQPEPQPQPQPQPTPQPMPDKTCPPGQCWDPHKHLGAGCVGINEPNYCDLL